jgi:hypothetical protein
VAKHPVTKPDLQKTIDYESVLNIEELIQNAIDNDEVMLIE